MIKKNLLAVLLVDDEQFWLESLSEILSNNGFKNQICGDPGKAVDAYKKENFEIVITNFMMPGMNGIELLKEIRILNPAAYIIILTGHVDAENVIEALNNGAYAFFRKPIEPKKLLEVLVKIEKEVQTAHAKEIWHSQLITEYKKFKKYLDSFEHRLEKMF